MIDNRQNVYQKFLYNTIIKRTCDFLLALVFMILLLPIFMLIALIIKIDSPGTVLYKGLRTGYKGKPFRIFKFRTMVMLAEKLGGGTTALNDKRITSIGHILRKTKLDEITQLINILLGQMSFIGPRPELPQYTKQYNEQEKLILSVRPGITDLSSKHFVSLDELVGSEDADSAYEKNILKHKNKLRMDYVKQQSFSLDCYLFFSTVFVLMNKIRKVVIS